MSRIDAQKAQLQKARDFLDRILNSEENEIQRAAAIQAFEVGFELAWKYLKNLVEENGTLVASPKSVFREAAKQGLLESPEVWFDFLIARNNTVHTYIEDLANEVYKFIRISFLDELDKLIRIEI
ncbi:MAG: nucleotidyltransferase [Acidimicrobiales bacterium]|nr:nucleotidyltransferase [Acidimicrobiales bacterium]